MLTATLFLIQSDYSSVNTKLVQLQSLLQSSDSVVLMGDAVLHAQHDTLQQVERLYVLDTDAALLIQQLPTHIQVISYAQFADICLAHTRCMTIK
ncbi:DsrH/TusB family sulfur relay protein [Acinetobacter tibetensis]|jgi:sulfur relay protein TusB/DsrH|uniref:DsrH/TusB family sulfur relay protein n=1 Tax=Acinetobacter tibetensis TaxID=2943497 RepID=A0AAE9S1A7_9GAMM|nr:DsrH/TusB family sulfur relay protein [Acinetobacter tibetensis]USE84667.1 DsrH/TusB family sulfur relay protein [Acinetobacter tibetensis]